jgi:sugar-specific transcriptional regulator TrmB
MRITTSMLAQTTRETGVPVAQGSLLDALNNQNTSCNLLDALNQNQNAKKAAVVQKEARELGNASESLQEAASKLAQTGEDSLFGKTEESKETTDIISEVKDMIESYNQTLELIKEADGSLSSFYYKELKEAAAGSAEQLKSVGITLNKDGSLAADEKALEKADYDTLKEVFGSESEFTKKAVYISSRISENAQTAAASVSSQYNAKGESFYDSFEMNKYNFFG